MRLKLVADENISRATILALRANGFGVVAVAERSPGIRDTHVLELACAENAWLITFDRDYGDLIFKRRQAAPPGIVYLRFSPANPEEPAARVIKAIEKFGTMRAFVVVSRKAGMRVRLLPAEPAG